MLFASAGAAFGLLSLAGWVANAPLLTTLLPARPALSPMTAFGLLLGAAGLAVLRTRPSLALKLGCVEAASGVLIVAAHMASLTAGGWLRPGWWSSSLTGVAFALSGASTALLARGRLAGGQMVAFGVLLLAVLLGMGHVFPSADLYALLPGTGVAIPTVAAFSALSVGQLLSFAQTGPSAAFTSRNAAGRMSLHLLVSGVAAALVLTVGLLMAHQRGLFDAVTAALLLAWSLIALLGGALWSLALAVDRAELAGLAAERERDEVRRMVAAAVTHDLRNPLHAAMLTGQLLSGLVSDPKASAVVARLQRSHQRLDRLFRSLLDGMVVGAGQDLTFRPSRFELGALVREVVSENDAVLAGRVSCEGQAEGFWDRDALFRVVENLLLNAVKYGDPGAPISCRVAVREGTEVALTVANRGSPIPPSDWETIFEPFARLEGVRGTGPIGWGVGLAYARSVAAGHGGSVKVVASGPERTVFELTLPVDSRRAAEDRRG